MAGLLNYDCEGTMTISSVSMNGPVWAIQADEQGNNGLLQILTLLEVRGEDRVLPGAVGVIPYRRRITSVRMDLRIVVAGDIDITYAPTVNHSAGLVANLAWLRANIIAPTGLTDGTRPATVTLPGLATRAANIHVLGLQGQEYHMGAGAVWVGTLQISIPSGEFV